jgi:hypothetical protein
MKINKITLSIAILLGLLFTFFLSNYTLEKNILIYSIGCFLSISIGIAGFISLNFNDNKISVNTKVVSVIFTLLAMGIQLFFSVFNDYDFSSYVLTVFGSLLIYVLFIYNISRTKM